MIGPFTPGDHGYRAELSLAYNALIRQLVHEVLVVIDEPAHLSEVVDAITGPERHRRAPDQPVLAQLLPPMSGDEALAGELRALAEDVLRAEKSAHLRALQRGLERACESHTEEVLVPTEEAWDWLCALNDVRFALAGELRVRTDDDVDAIHERAGNGEGGPTALASSAYVLVSWWQDSLLRAMREVPVGN